MASLPVFGCAVVNGEGDGGADGDTTEEPTPEVESACDGIDNDGDGIEDEGYPDLDSDGVADCIDAWCGGDTLPVEAIPMVEECQGGDPASPGFWDIQEQWRWTGDGLEGQPWMAIGRPSTGQLDDDNGDGVIDSLDVLDVVFVSYSESGELHHGWLVALDGATGGSSFALPGYDAVGEVLVADLHSSPGAEMVAWVSSSLTSAEALHLLSSAGEVIWAVDVLPDSPRYAVLIPPRSGETGWDLLVGSTRLLAETGEVVAEYGLWELGLHRSGIIDFEGDGDYEIVVRNQVYSGSGDLLWSGPEVLPNLTQWWAPVDVDGDGSREIAFLTNGLLQICDSGGALLDEFPAGGRAPYPPCIADLDGDGQDEIAFGHQDIYGSWDVLLRAMEFDGGVLWEIPIIDDSGAAACSAADLDGDGTWEVLFAGEERLSIFDGTTGLELGAWAEHRSGTYLEYPVPADLDGDGTSELLVITNGNTHTLWDWSGLHAFASAAAGWAPVDGPWYGWEYPLAGVHAGLGEVPGDPSRSPGLRAAAPGTAMPSIDLVPLAQVDCVSGCGEPGTVRLAIQVGNQGPVGAAPGVEVVVTAVDDGDAEEMGGLYFQEEIEPGGTTGIQYLRVGLSPLAGRALAAQVRRPPGFTQPDCDAGNDRILVAFDNPCD